MTGKQPNSRSSGSPAPTRGAARPASTYRGRAYSRRRKKIRRIRFLAACAAVVLLIILLIVLLQKDSSKNPEQRATAASLPTAEPTLPPEETEAPSPEPEIRAEETLSPEDAGETSANPPQRVTVNRLPEPMAEGFLPIVTNLETDEKIIAVTVDDFFQFKNARTIIDVAIENGAKLTMFPIGKNVMREELQDTLRYAYENGMEIENHTYSHSGLYNETDEGLAKQMYYQSLAVDLVLGVDYHQHFIRPMGGDARKDQRIHLYAKQLGMYGIAHWNVTGSGTDLDKLLRTFKPGNIYLFHTTDKDTAKLKQFIPAAVAAGYRLVTLNEMFGLPDNEVTEQTTSPRERETPPLAEYTLTPVTVRNGDYMYLAKLIQDRLHELDYLSGDSDGIYGPGTAKAVKQFQQKNGLEATGKADARTQEILFSDSAKKR